MKANSRNIQVLVADDEALARKRMLKLLDESGVSLNAFEATTGKETIATMLVENLDLVFLDIKMTDMTGFDVLQQLPSEKIPIIIFVTAFDTFALRAFEVRAIDFLLKPYKKERFFNALNRGIEQLELTKRQSFQLKVAQLMESIDDEQWDGKNKDSFLEQLVLKMNKKYYFVKTKEINYVKASGYYAEIFTANGKKHVYRISMTDLTEKLNPDEFSRINRSAIVNRNQIKEIVSEGLGDFSAIMKDGTSFSVTKHYKSEFLKQMGIR